MTGRSCLALAVVTAGVSSVPVSAEDWPHGNARVRLVANAERAEPSQPTLIGVHFDIKPGWHIYWRNPGGAGMATEIGWRLPAGVTAGEIQWPLPIAFTQSGDIPGYGYEDEIVLASELGGARLADDDVVGASISWLACKDVCVLGSAKVESRWSEVAGDPVFTHWRSNLPTAWSADDAPFSVTTTGGLSSGAVSLWLRWRESPGDAEWFPDPSDGLVVEDVEISTRGGLSRIDASVRKMAGAEGDFDTLPSVVAVTDKHGKRRGWTLAVELTDDNS
jgi:DsbC/DsbD-like thiol-disulfide interchange protein